MKKTELIGIACIAGMAATLAGFYFSILSYDLALVGGYGWIAACAIIYNGVKDEGDDDDEA